MKTLVLLSGGLDSNVSLALCLSRADVEQVHALIFKYGQSSINEVSKAETLCLAWGVAYTVKELDMGTATDTHKELPMRNLIFIAQAAKLAKEMEFDTIVFGAEPDSTYTDSSNEFINKADQLLKMFSLNLWAPVKNLANKTEVVRYALDLGVPLHLCHSSRSNKVDGECKTSARFLAAVGNLFPNYFKPEWMLKKLGTVQYEWKNPTHCRIYYQDHPQNFPFKYAAAMFTVAAHPALKQLFTPIKVFTTGSWGQCLVYHAEIAGLHNLILPQITHRLSDLLYQPINGDSQWAQWGYKQALSLLPRPRYATHVACRITQGHLAKALQDLGYRVTVPCEKLGICLETSITL